MKHIATAALALSLLGLASPLSAHAFLEHATPGVGSTISTAPSELELSFSQNVEAPLSGVSIASLGGAAIAASKPVKDAADQASLHVRLSRPLAPGTYVVKWHVVSVDTHPTSGSYKFTVAP